MTSDNSNPVPNPVKNPNRNSLGEVIFTGISLWVLFLFLRSCDVDWSVKSLRADACRECAADGIVKVSCFKCRGRGYYGGVKCEACQHTGKVEQTCRFCGGSGKKPK